jgi:hypothetical protein
VVGTLVQVSQDLCISAGVKRGAEQDFLKEIGRDRAGAGGGE